MSPPGNVRRCGINLDPLLRSCAGLLCRASTSDAVVLGRKCRTGGGLKKTWACAASRTVTTKEDTTRGLARVLGWDSLDMGCGTCAWFVRVGGVWGVGCLRGGVGLQSHPWGCSLHRLLPACACMCFMDVCAWVCGSMCLGSMCFWCCFRCRLR